VTAAALNRQAAEVLARAATIVATGWTQRASARVAPDDDEDLGRHDAEGATCWCAGTAINRAATLLFGADPLGFGPINHRADAIAATLDLEASETMASEDANAWIVDFNDDRATTQAMVIARLIAAAEVARGGGSA
jgi:hypothetical protein